MARALTPNAPRLGPFALALALVAFGPRALAASPPKPPAASTQGSAKVANPIRATHVVADGQTLGGIALRYRLTVDELRRANGLTPNQVLRVGSRLNIPVAGAFAAPPAGAKGGATVQASLPPASRFTSPVAGGAPRGSVRIALGSEVWQGKIREGRGGKLSNQALEGFSRILRFSPTNKRTSINPRLLEAVSAVSDHFGGRTLRVVSGYRPPSPRQYTPHSRHNVGAAVDFIVEGVPNEVLRDFCRTLGNVGVGYYPNSSFVHLDARNAPTTWVDYSGPGEAPRYAGPGGQDPDSHHHDDDSGGSAIDLPFGRSFL